MEIPQGHVLEGDRKKVCLLKRALYGLKQTPKVWNTRIVEFFKSKNFLPLVSDSCIFSRNNTWIALYVDDIVIVTRTVEESNEIVKMIKAEFD